jgi:hypothetical protein
MDTHSLSVYHHFPYSSTIWRICTPNGSEATRFFFEFRGRNAAGVAESGAYLIVAVQIGYRRYRIELQVDYRELSGMHMQTIPT